MNHNYFTRRTVTGELTLMIASLCLLPGLVVAQLDKSENEQELIAVLASADSPKADKAIACKRLAIYGTSASVGELAKLLGDEQLSSWARTALEAIPGKEPDDALRTAASSVKGRQLIGVINSIGVRRDAEAVDVLKKHLMDSDAEVASATAVALGRIGNSAAVDILRQALSGEPKQARSAVAEGLVLAAERFMLAGDEAKAVEIYDQVRLGEVPQQRIVEGTRGAILARKEKGIPLLLEELRAPEYFRLQVALATAREMEGTAVDQALASELKKAPADRAALIIQSMADRKTVDVSAILQEAVAGEKVTRLSALNAIRRVGNASCVERLIAVAGEPDADLVEAAKVALAQLPDEQANSEIASRLSKASGPSLAMLIGVVGERGIAATEELIAALKQEDPQVRAAALTALGDVVPANRLSVLISQFLTPKYPEDRPHAEKALKTAAVRMPDREACAGELVAAMEKAAPAIKVPLLEVLAAVGGTKALQALEQAAKSNSEPLRDASTRLLGSWMTIDAAPVLLDLSKRGPMDRYQVRAVRGYLRIARQFAMSESERIAMAQQAMEIARDNEEKKLVLDVVKRYPHVELLKIAVKIGESPALREDAKDAAKVVRDKLKEKSPEVVELLSKLGL